MLYTPPKFDTAQFCSVQTVCLQQSCCESQPDFDNVRGPLMFFTTSVEVGNDDVNGGKF